MFLSVVELSARNQIYTGRPFSAQKYDFKNKVTLARRFQNGSTYYKYSVVSTR